MPLILDAQIIAKVSQRSIAGQIEFWASLGRAVEPLLRGREVLALRKAGAARPLSECLESINSPEGRQRVADYFNPSGFRGRRSTPG